MNVTGSQESSGDRDDGPLLPQHNEDEAFATALFDARLANLENRTGGEMEEMEEEVETIESILYSSLPDDPLEREIETSLIEELL
jgi:hypothetical protein